MLIQQWKWKLGLNILLMKWANIYLYYGKLGEVSW